MARAMTVNSGKAARGILAPPSGQRARTARVALALFGGALLFGALASLADPTRVGVRIALLVTLALALVYLAIVVLAVRSIGQAPPAGPTLDQFLALTPTEFEEVVGELLSRSGYSAVRHVGGAGDLAADLTCRDARGRRVVVQCKRYAPETRVGSQVVQTFMGMVAIHHRADYGILVTTSSFTTPAIELAHEHDFLLLDGPALVKLAADVLGQTEPIEPYDPDLGLDPRIE